MFYQNDIFNYSRALVQSDGELLGYGPTNETMREVVTVRDGGGFSGAQESTQIISHFAYFLCVVTCE